MSIKKGEFGKDTAVLSLLIKRVLRILDKDINCPPFKGSLRVITSPNSFYIEKRIEYYGLVVRLDSLECVSKQKDDMNDVRFYKLRRDAVLKERTILFINRETLMVRAGTPDIKVRKGYDVGNLHDYMMDSKLKTFIEDYFMNMWVNHFEQV